MGDVALFYSLKAYRCYATILYKWEDPSNIPLPVHAGPDNESFPLNFVVDEPADCYLSIADYNDLRGFKPGYYPADPHVASGDDATAVLAAIGRLPDALTRQDPLLSAEGQRKYRRHLAVERRSANRQAVLAAKGHKCEACDFDFRSTYGDQFGDYAEVHHLRPLSLGVQAFQSLVDFAVLCANCHRAVHRQSPIEPMPVSQLRAEILQRRL